MATKAENLVKLYNYQKKINIYVPKIIFFSKKYYLKNNQIILKKIQNKFKNKKIILRSSSKLEDKQGSSNAGKFKSYPDLNPDSKKIKECINLICEDFNSLNDQIIAQEFISKPDISGVIFTRNINNNSPYYFVNIDSSGRTDLVTSGQSNPSMKTLVFYRDTSKYKVPKKYKKLLEVTKKIERIFNNDRIDIEFCIKNEKIYIFQCRPLKKLKNVNDELIDDALINITMKIEKLKRANPLISGNKTFFSNMADWNPAEMIGNRPSTLSMSLYSELITDHVWAIQRKNYGYNDLSSFPLMLNLGGSPYVDLRIDFNSFIPSKIPLNLKKKIINYYLNKIQKNKDSHDKVEFDVIETCFDIETESKVGKFLKNKEKKIYIGELRNLTNDILLQNKGNFNYELNKINLLTKQINKINNSSLSEIHKIYFLIKSCKELGTLPFAGLARSAFIATRILKSLNKKKLILDKQMEGFYSSIKSITNKFNNDLLKINSKLDKSKFLTKYGHLRPSTYSISSKNYRENFNNYFSFKSIKINTQIKNFKIDTSTKKEITRILKKNKIKINCDNFLIFAKESIKLREYSKFIFTKCIDEIFKNLISLGKEIQINRSELEHLSIKNIIKYYNNVESAFKLKKQIKKEILENKKNLNLLNLIEFPDFIEKKEDMYFHSISQKKGNFITNRKTNGHIVDFSKLKKYDQLEGGIILLENADPGYDFIFSKNIKGLITEYGGANSHMSIRCLELGIPAIIGIGSKEFNFLRTRKNMEINAFQKIYRILN